MLASVLSFSPDLADQVSEYCENHSDALPEHIKEHWDWTLQSFVDADKMSSKLQGQWMIWMAQWIAPKRGTKETQAEIVTLELSAEMITVAKEIFEKTGCDDRINLVEGPASETLASLDGEFDVIFLDADKIRYELYIDTILKRKLLSHKRVIFCDNVFARRLTMGKNFNPYLDRAMRPFWETNGEALRDFNKGLVEDPRIDVAILPLFDGVTQIKWRQDR